jgi:hypothetical protein
VRDHGTLGGRAALIVTDDSIQVRQLSHCQFTWVAGEANAPGTWTLQLVNVNSQDGP